MMKNRFLAAVMAVLAGVSLTSCDELQEIIDNVIEVSITAENDAFDADGQAVVKLSLNSASNKDITVILGLSSEAEEGFTAVDSNALDFDGSVTIPAGTASLPVTIKVKEDAEILENQEAVITIASATGASVGKNSVAYIKVPVRNYNGGDKEDEDKVSVSIAAESDVFDDNGEAVVKVSLSKASEKEISVTLGVGSEAQEGYAAISALALAFEPVVNIAAGATEASVKIAVVLDAVEEGQEAVIVIASASGAEVAEGAVAYIKVPESQQQNGDAFKLNWNVKYLGCEWIEGYYSYGQLEVFEVSNTDTQKFYNPILVDLSEEEDLAAALAADPNAFFTALQAEMEDEIAEEMEYWDETREEAIPELYYNEINDGTEILFYGLPAGKYQFIIVSMDANGILDKGYSVIEFTKTTDALESYDWNLNLTVNPDWYAKFDGWIEGYENKYYYVEGYTPGAAYVLIESYTDDELDYYLDGDIKTFFNDAQTKVKDDLASGYEMSEIATEVDEDGFFLDYLSTYGITGETHIYIAAFDANGNILSTYGDSVIEIPVYEEEPINWVEKTGWAVNYDATVDTGEEDYPQAIVATVCDAPYFLISLYSEGTLEENGIDVIAKAEAADIKSYLGYYTMDELIEYNVVYNSVPAVSAWSGVYNGVEAYLIAIDVNGNPTGEWHMEVIEGIEEVPVEPLELSLQENWSVELDGDPFDYNGKTYCYLKATVPGIKYFYLEEDTDEDLAYYYDGSVEVLIRAYEEDFQGLSNPTDYLWAEGEEGLYVRIWNPGTESKIYIMEFDETGTATGRYGVSTVQIPAVAASAPAIKAPSVGKAFVKAGKAFVKGQPKTAELTIAPRFHKSAVKVDQTRKSLKAVSPKVEAPISLKKLIRK